MADLQTWIKERAKEDERLYERFGKPLETEHTGEYVAINSDGELILGESHLPIIEQALERFGRGNFAFRRVGYPLEERFPARRIT